MIIVAVVFLEIVTSRVQKKTFEEIDEEAIRGGLRSIAFNFTVGWMHKFAMNADSMPTNGM